MSLTRSAHRRAAVALAAALLAADPALAAPPSAHITPATASAAAAPAPDAAATRALHTLFERHFERVLDRFPEWSTFRGDGRRDDRLADMSIESLDAWNAETARWRDEASAIDPAKLSHTDRVSRQLFIDQLQRELDIARFAGWRGMRVGALWGVQSALASLLQVQPVRSEVEVERLLARLAAVPRRMEQELVLMRRSQALGYVPARDVLQRAIAQIDAQFANGLEASPYAAPLKRLGPAIPEARCAVLAERLRAALARDVEPPMRALRAYLVDEALPKAPAEGGLAGYPDGRALYEVLVREQTTTKLTARQIHDTGLAELTRVRTQMEAIARETKFEGGDFAAFVRFLNTDARFFSKTPEELLAGYRDWAKRFDAEIPRLFAELPRMPYGIRPMPAFRGPDAAEYYDRPAADGTRAGWFNANAVGFRKKPSWSMATLVAHEAVPGHHLQVARAMELQGLPAFRREGGYTAYVEGWALYAETLGLELGLYEDPYVRFGHLQMQAFRAARLVVDTGIHALGWNRTQAIDFMTERTGLDRGFVTSEVDRYASNPGQALAYMTGQLKIQELRRRATERLGPRFDIRRFHNAVLDQGALPLDVLEAEIDAWIAREETRR